MRDRLFAQRIADVGNFEFGDDVAGVFDDMIRRSVPGYGSVLAMLPHLARRYAMDSGDDDGNQADTGNVYDLGCSLGAASIAVAAAGVPAERIVAIDSSLAMIERLRLRIEQTPSLHAMRVVHDDILTTPLHSASLVMLNFTLQFIAPSDETI